MTFANMFKSMSKDLAAFVNNNPLFQTFITLQNHANNVLDRGSQFNTSEGKIDRKVKICEPRELCHPSTAN